MSHDSHIAGTADVAGRPLILIADDDAALCEELGQYLHGHGMISDTATDMASASALFENRQFDLVLLDLWLGRDNGFDMLRTLRRAREVPCIMMTAQQDVTEKIVGLELGADDYVFKPINPRELLARIRALLRRAAGLAAIPSHALAQSGVLREHSAWSFDPARRSLRGPDGSPVSLTTAECDLLIVLTANEGRPQTRADLCHKVFHRSWQPEDRSLDSVVVNLRRKLEPDPEHPLVIQSIRGTGYLFTGFPPLSPVGRYGEQASPSKP